MKILILFTIIFVLSFTAFDQNAFGLFGCDNPHCYSLLQSSRSSSIQGIEYELDSPDLWIDRTACLNVAVSTGWLVASTLPPNQGPEWIEGGITKGDMQNVGCVTELSTYYAFNFFIDEVPVYQEYLVPNGRVDPGDNIKVTLQTHLTDQVQVYVTTPYVNSQFPTAQVNMNPNNIYDGDIGIEGTISALDEYSSIPMSKFTNIKIKQSNTWINLPSSATHYKPDIADGYIGELCTNTSFVTGTVMSTDCNVAATRNQIPTPVSENFDISTNDPITISLNAVDTDMDYLKYYLVEFPSNGFLDHNNIAEKIPNVTGDTSQLIYTPASNPPVYDIIRYSVTDVRDGHTREGLMTITGPTPEPTIPDAVDDFQFSLSNTTIHLTWSHPFDGGSPITSYTIERSVDTATWQHHDTISETLTSLDYDRYEGYDQYFRIFTNNLIGNSASSNILYVHIPDTTPPNVTIQNPIDNVIITIPDVYVDGYIFESQSSGIENIQIKIDDILNTDPISTNIISIDTNVEFDSTLTGLTNGDHVISLYATNGDGYTGNDSVSVTLDVPIPSTLDLFSDGFETDMSNWMLATEDDEYWSIRDSPIIPIPDMRSTNKVAGTEDCDNICTMIMIDHVDLTSMISPQLSFYRFVATGADISSQEGIIAYVSEDDGTSWSILERFTADEYDDDGLWHLQEYDLNSYSSSTQFKLKFEAISSSNSEDTELDDITIYDANPVLPPTPDFKIQRGNLIMNSTDTTSSIIEGVDFEQCTGDCYIQITGSKNTGMGKTFNGGIGNFDNWTSFISDDSGLHTSGGAIDFTRHVTDNRDNRITWQITEHIGELTGPNEMKVLDTGVCNFGNSTLTCSVNIQNGATDGNDVVVLITGVASPDDGLADLQTMLVTAQWDDLSDTAIFTRGESNNDATKISYAVIEYSGTNWSVQRITHNGTSEDLSTETLTNDVGDISRAFIAQVQQRNSAGDTYNRICQSGEEVWISNTNELSFNHPWFSVNWDSNITEVVWVVSNSETDTDKAMIVQHLQPTDQRDTIGTEEENWQVAINPLTYSTDETALTGISTHTDGCGTSYPNSSILGILFESGLDQVDFYQSDAGQEQDYAFSVVQYPRSIPSP